MHDETRLFLNSKVYVADSKIHGRGVFTSATIYPDEIIEQAHVVHPANKSANNLDEVYRKYFFSWPFLKQDWKKYVDQYGSLSIDQISYPVCVLGFGMIYNHNKINPNATAQFNTQENFVEFRAIKKIEPFEEITICYNPKLDL